MESPEDEEDVKLVKASAGLLADLEATLPRLLWKRRKSENAARRVHTQVKQRDLDYVIRLVSMLSLLSAIELIVQTDRTVPG